MRHINDKGVRRLADEEGYTCKCACGIYTITDKETKSEFKKHIDEMWHFLLHQKLWRLRRLAYQVGQCMDADDIKHETDKALKANHTRWCEEISAARKQIA